MNEVKIIKNFKGENAWLSNMQCFTLPNDNKPTSVEGLFQAAKALCLRDDVQNEQLYDRIAYANPYEARKMGRNIKDLDITKWNKYKLVIMANAVFTKFMLNEKLCIKLLNAGLTTYLIEENTWGDTYWGVYNGKGHNYLGKLIMYIRDILFSSETEKLVTFYDNDIAYEILIKEIENTITEEYLDKHYPMPKLNMNIQMFADKTSLDVSPCETSSKEVLNINKKEEKEMKYNIQIKNMHNEKPKFAWQVKVDRSSILGNNTRMKDPNNDKERDYVCEEYEKFFIMQIKQRNELFIKEFLRLANIYKKYNKIDLFCWCAPKRCHAETIKKYLERYLENDGYDPSKQDKFDPDKPYTSLSVINEYLKDLPIYLAKLTPDIWKINKDDNDETRAQKSLVLNKYFRFDNHSLDRFHLPDLTEDEYEFEILSYRNVKLKNQKFKTASDYFKKKVQMNIVLRDLGIEGYSNDYCRACKKQPADRLSLKGYRGSPELFEFPSWEDNMYWLREEKYLQDMFDPDNKYPSMKELYIDSDPYRSTDYIEIFTKCWNLVKNLVKRRTVMITGADSLIFSLCNLIKKTEGLQGGASKGQIAALEKYFKEIKNITDNKEVSEWVLKGNNDYTLYVLNGDSTTAKDYIETYQKILRTVFNVRPNESLNSFKWYLKFECLGNKRLKDRLEQVILKNEGIETEYLWDSKSSDESEDIEDNPEYYEDCLLSI